MFLHIRPEIKRRRRETYCALCQCDLCKKRKIPIVVLQWGGCRKWLGFNSKVKKKEEERKEHYGAGGCYHLFIGNRMLIALDVYQLNFHTKLAFDLIFGSRSGTWWQRRTRLERRLSLCATVVVFVAVGLAVAMAALIYRGQQTNPSKGACCLLSGPFVNTDPLKVQFRVN